MRQWRKGRNRRHDRNLPPFARHHPGNKGLYGIEDAEHIRLHERISVVCRLNVSRSHTYKYTGICYQKVDRMVIVEGGKPAGETWPISNIKNAVCYNGP
jgi:hypothetical protein